MRKKSTATIDEEVYKGLYVPALELVYSEMALDKSREFDAMAWSEEIIGDLDDAAR
ncbi:MAG: hypothetical protein HKM04_11430 [Legionellales bacterium]|nr:hypothetical protein [Legionellales bacterium]